MSLFLGASNQYNIPTHQSISNNILPKTRHAHNHRGSLLRDPQHAHLQKHRRLLAAKKIFRHSTEDEGGEMVREWEHFLK